MSEQTLTASPVRPARRARSRGWLLATGLILLNLIPVAFGALRITEVAMGTELTDANPRVYFDSPIPIVAHIVGATVFTMLGALQFVPGLRRRRWHRIAGRILVPAGLVAAIAGIWMAVAYPRIPLDVGVRAFFGSLMIVFILLGFRAILRRDIAAHRAWMIRGYAVAAAAGTQLLTALAWAALTGGEPTTPVGTAVLMASAWVINLAIAELAIRRGRRRSVA